MFDALLLIHIVAAMVWIGGGIAALLIGGRIRAGGDRGAYLGFIGALGKLGGPMFGGSGVLVLLTGLGMVAMDGGPAFGQLWVVLGLAGWLVTLLMGAVLVGGSWAKVGKEMATSERTLDDMAPAIDRAILLSWVDIALRIGVVAIMVWRPL
jgi:hypothetical protein